MPIKHSFTSSKSDGADSTLVKPSDWNAAHVVPVPDLLQSQKTSADTPDDDFDSGTLDGKWTVVDGASGTASLLNSSGTGLYDLSTRSGWLLMQTGTASGDSVELRQDYTLPDGACIVLPVSISLDVAAALTNNEMWMGVCVNDSDTGPFSGTAGQTAAVFADSEDAGNNSNGFRIIAYDGTSFIGLNHGGGQIRDISFLRIDRSSLTYHCFWSSDGFSWTYLGSKTMSTAANNVWVFAQCNATMANRIVVGVPWVRQGTALAVDPWSL